MTLADKIQADKAAQEPPLTSPSRELLESLTNWLETRSHMPMAIKGGQGKLMREYAAELRKYIPTAPPAPVPSLESLFGKGKKA